MTEYLTPTYETNPDELGWAYEPEVSILSNPSAEIIDFCNICADGEIKNAQVFLQENSHKDARNHPMNAVIEEELITGVSVSPYSGLLSEPVCTPLSLAVQNNQREIIALLLSEGVNMYHCDIPLLCYGSFSTARYLLSHGFDPYHEPGLCSSTALPTPCAMYYLIKRGMKERANLVLSFDQDESKKLGELFDLYYNRRKFIAQLVTYPQFPLEDLLKNCDTPRKKVLKNSRSQSENTNGN